MTAGDKRTRQQARIERRRARVLEATTPAEQLVRAFDLLRAALSRRAKTDPAGADKVRRFMLDQLLTAAEKVEKGWTP
jgi:hypothetical protein